MGILSQGIIYTRITGTDVPYAAGARHIEVYNDDAAASLTITWSYGGVNYTRTVLNGQTVTYPHVGIKYTQFSVNCFASGATCHVTVIY